ncbi:MAG TPA: TIGR02147 family protein [Chitinivibrionales bacterium]|nr:TIGR02147 family protein [Chitinivibrionales bacterium]
MEKIFKYIDYRKFLLDYYNEKKSTTRFFSYRYFSNKAGIKSPVFLKQVIEGERNLTLQTMDKFILALSLNKKEAVFFRHLVQFNQATMAYEKQEHYSVMLSMMDYVNEHRLTADQYIYFDKWYNSAVRELVCLRDFRDNWELIAKSLRPAISPRDAKNAVQLLLRLNLIKKQKNGAYRQVNSAITSGSDVVSLARRSFNSTMLLLARDSNESLPPDTRNISGITMGISEACYEVLLAELAAFKERVISIVNRDENSNRVYQFNFQIFPLSQDVSNIGTHDKGKTV